MPYRLVVDSIVIQRVVKYICSIRNEHGFYSLCKTKKNCFSSHRKSIKGAIGVSNIIEVTTAKIDRLIIASTYLSILKCVRIFGIPHIFVFFREYKIYISIHKINKCFVLVFCLTKSSSIVNNKQQITAQVKTIHTQHR